MLAVVVKGTVTEATPAAAAAAATTTTASISSASSSLSSAALSRSPLDAIFAGLGIGGSEDLVADGGAGAEWEGEGDKWGGPVSSKSSPPLSPPPPSSSSGPVAPSFFDGNDGNVEGSGHDDHRPRSHFSSFLSYNDDDDDDDGALYPSSADLYLSTLRARAQAIKTRLRTLPGWPDGKMEEATGILARLFRDGPTMVEEPTVAMLSRLGRVYRAARSWHQMLRLTLQEHFDHVGGEKDEKVEQKVRVTQTLFYTAIGIIVLRLLVTILSAVWVVVKAVAWMVRVVVDVLRMKWVRWGLLGLLIMWLLGLL